MFDKKAQSGPVGLIFLVIVFIIIWAVWLGQFVTTMGQQAIQATGLTGLEAFIYANINLFIFIALVLGIMGFMYFSAR